jgi:hypothetical protein
MKRRFQMKSRLLQALQTATPEDLSAARDLLLAVLSPAWKEYD